MFFRSINSNNQIFIFSQKNLDLILKTIKWPKFDRSSLCNSIKSKSIFIWVTKKLKKSPSSETVTFENRLKTYVRKTLLVIFGLDNFRKVYNILHFTVVLHSVIYLILFKSSIIEFIYLFVLRDKIRSIFRI